MGPTGEYPTIKWGFGVTEPGSRCGHDSGCYRIAFHPSLMLLTAGCLKGQSGGVGNPYLSSLELKCGSLSDPLGRDQGVLGTRKEQPAGISEPVRSGYRPRAE